MTNFSEFSTPPAHQAFSNEYFEKLTFAQARELEHYPQIAPVGSVTYQGFSTDIPSTAVGTIIAPNEVIPHIQDLGEVAAGMESAFKEGARSVVVSFAVGGVQLSTTYHFSKIHLIRLISNHEVAVRTARLLIEHLESESANFQLGSAFSHFSRCAILAPIKGFFVTEFPLWELGFLLNEGWLHEDALNALMELLYFRQCALSDSSILACHDAVRKSAPLILPASFLSDARRIFDMKPRQFSAEIINIRERLRHGTMSTVTIPSICDNHFVGYVYRPGSCIIEHGDSLGGPPASDILPILQWVFSDIDKVPITQIESVDVALQGGANGGEGSCGLATLNFLERAVDQHVVSWSGSQSAVFRDSALEDLVLYHYIADQYETSFLNWVTEVIPLYSNQFEDRACGYKDFNVYKPSLNHPIYSFLNSNATDLQHLVRPPVVPQVPNLKSVPRISSLSSLLLSIPMDLSNNHTLLPAFDTNPTLDSKVASKRKVSDAFKLVETRVPKVYRVSPSASPVLTDMKLVAPTTPPLKLKAEPDVIDLCTPEAKSVPQVRSLPSSIPTVKIEIDLCSPDEKVPLTQRRQTTPSAKVEIDLCSPDVKPLAHTVRIVEPAPGVVQLGATFPSWEDAQTAIYTREERLGHQWRLAQSKSDNKGNRKKITFRCNRYQFPGGTHSIDIDPSDYRNGKSIRTGCNAHVNVNRVLETNLWRVTFTDWNHNHAREIPEGAPTRRLPTAAEKDIISRLATDSTQNFSRGQITSFLKSQNVLDLGSSLLEPRQISNIINSARKEARQHIDTLGGDIPAIIANLEQKNSQEHGWRYHIKVDESGVVTGIWWQSPTQSELGRRYGDVLINDNTYNRNRSGYPLNIGIVIDGNCSSRNVWYALHAIEDVAHHNWVFDCHLDSAGNSPESLMSDRSKSLIASAEERLPTTDHFYCIHHLGGNVETQLRRILASHWGEFSTCFWRAYRAVSPEEFDKLWSEMTAKFPAAKSYLDDELYSCRTQWAWAFTSFQFTCGVRTNGRAEGENRVNKTIGGPKKAMYHLYEGLNERTLGQSVQDMIQVRESSRRQHARSIETIFPGPLTLLRKHAGPYALQTTFKQMELSMFYQTEVMKLPDGMRDWNEYAIAASDEIGYEWQGGEENSMINQFENDAPYISTKWLLRLVRGRGLLVEHLLRVTHKGSSSVHMVALLPDNCYVCDCCMGMNLGIPCRHYFQVLSVVKNLKFDLRVVRPRWYQDKDLDMSTVLPVAPREHQATWGSITNTLPPRSIVSSSTTTSNPLQVIRTITAPTAPTAPPLTQTIPARTVYHESQAALKSLMTGIQTREQLDGLLEGLKDIRSSQIHASQQDDLGGLPILNPKGRPRTQRITGALEGRARGGGARIQTSTHAGRKCGVCRQVGHNRAGCPLLPPD